MSRRVVALIVAMAVVLFALFALTTRPERQEAGLIFSYASTDAGPGGTLALRRWLASLDFRTESLQGQRFAIPADVEVVFLLGPLEIVTAADAETLRRFVEAGGLAIVASDRGIFDDQLFRAFGLALRDRPKGALGGEIAPALGRPPFRDLSTGAARALRLTEPAAVLVGDGERAMVVERRIGAGKAFFSSAPDMVANTNLGAAQNDRLVLNLIADARPGAVIAFDEFHHGAHVEPDVFSLFTDTPPGQAALFAGIAVFAYVALRGRRFGAPVPLQERAPRSSLDYVRSFAGLLRRSGARALAGERLARVYRRRIARAIGVRPTSTAADVVAALERNDPARAATMGDALARLESALTDNDLLAVTERAENVAREVERA